jgi:hypothetical protein
VLAPCAAWIWWPRGHGMPVPKHRQPCGPDADNNNMQSDVQSQQVSRALLEPTASPVSGFFVGRGQLLRGAGEGGRVFHRCSTPTGECKPRRRGLLSVSQSIERCELRVQAHRPKHFPSAVLSI